MTYKISLEIAKMAMNALKSSALRLPLNWFFSSLIVAIAVFQSMVGLLKRCSNAQITCFTKPKQTGASASRSSWRMKFNEHIN